MGYIELKTIPDVYLLDAFNGYYFALLFDDEDKHSFKHLAKIDSKSLLISTVHEKLIPTASCFTLANNVYCNLFRGGGVLYNCELNELSKEEILIQSLDELRQFAICILIIGGTKKLGLLDVNNFKILWAKEFRTRYNCFDGQLVFVELYDYNIGSLIYCFEILSGEQRWVSTLKNEANLGLHLNGFIGVDEKYVFASTSSMELLFIDKHNGNIAKIFSILAPEQSLILHDKRQIIGLNNKGFWQIDLNSNKYDFFELSHTFLQQQIEVLVAGVLTYRKGYLFFCSDFFVDTEHGTDSISKIGAFDVEQRKITWTHQFNFEPKVRLQSPAPIIHNDKLFVLDSKNRLHIFGEVQIPD